MTEETCDYCGDEILDDDLHMRIMGRQWVPLRQESAVFHAGCFMDIVNSEEGVVCRTDIMEGNLERDEE